VDDNGVSRANVLIVLVELVSSDKIGTATGQTVPASANYRIQVNFVMVDLTAS